MRFAAILLASFTLSCNTARNVSGDWRVEVRTDGGFTGGGIGSVVVTPATIEAKDLARTCSAALTTADRSRLEAAIGSAAPARWRDEYRSRKGADMVRYTLSLTHGSERQETSWDDGTRKELPAGVGSLFDAVWKLRQKTLEECATGGTAQSR